MTNEDPADRLLRAIWGAPENMPRLDADTNCQWHALDAANVECLETAGVGVYIHARRESYKLCGVHAEMLYARPPKKGD